MILKQELPVCPISKQTVKEEIVNSVTHGLGVLLGIIGFVLLMNKVQIAAGIVHPVAMLVYSITLLMLYTASMIYHLSINTDDKRLWQNLDHACIYLFIAGSYTPYTLILLKGQGGEILFTLIWGIAITGIINKFSATKQSEKLSTLLFIIMGWLCVLLIIPLWESLSLSAFILLVAGGLSYTIGSIFFLWEAIPFNHGIWHLFVLLGSILHYLSILSFA